VREYSDCVVLIKYGLVVLLDKELITDASSPVR